MDHKIYPREPAWSEALKDAITIAGFGIVISLFIIAIGFVVSIVSMASIERKYWKQASEQNR